MVGMRPASSCCSHFSRRRTSCMRLPSSTSSAFQEGGNTLINSNFFLQPQNFCKRFLKINFLATQQQHSTGNAPFYTAGPIRSSSSCCCSGPLGGGGGTPGGPRAEVWDQELPLAGASPLISFVLLNLAQNTDGIAGVAWLWHYIYSDSLHLDVMTIIIKVKFYRRKCGFNTVWSS